MLRVITLVLGLLIGLSGPSVAVTPQQELVLLLKSACPGTVRLIGLCPSLDMNFAASRYWVQGQGYVPITALLTTTRTQTVNSYATDIYGNLIPFAANTPRITNQGILIEQASTNTALYSRDMTQAAWTAVNMTTSKTGTGADGTANSATVLTATATNATILQALTISISAETYSVYLKRVSGSGTINISENGGSSWAACTINSISFTRCFVEASLANPSVGIQIVTSGDSIIADFNQNEALSFPTSPIPTTTISVTRNIDKVQGSSLLTSFYIQQGFSLYYKYLLQNAAANAVVKRLGTLGDGTPNNFLQALIPATSTSAQGQFTIAGSIVVTGTVNAGVDNSVNKIAVVAQTGTNLFFIAQNGTLSTTSTLGTLPTKSSVNTFWLGANNSATNQILDGYIQRLSFLPILAQAQAQQLTLLP